MLGRVFLCFVAYFSFRVRGGRVLLSKLLLRGLTDLNFGQSPHSTVTDFAKFRGWSMLQPRSKAM
jgi:hypothetical protein